MEKNNEVIDANDEIKEVSEDAIKTKASFI